MTGHHHSLSIFLKKNFSFETVLPSVLDAFEVIHSYSMQDFM